MIAPKHDDLISPSRLVPRTSRYIMVEKRPKEVRKGKPILLSKDNLQQLHGFKGYISLIKNPITDTYSLMMEITGFKQRWVPEGIYEEMEQLKPEEVHEDELK